jgi:lysozyme
MLGLLATAGLSLGGIFSGVFLIAPHESKVNSGYLDPVGIATSCWGHTGNDVILDKYYTNQECIKQLTGDVQQADKEMKSVIKVPLTFYQEAALISFTYNVGVTNLRNSTLAKDFNAGKYTEGCNQLSRWVYANGKKLQGLVIRREQERQVCLGNVRSWELND